MANQIKNKNGKTITLLNPHEKGFKYSQELKHGIAIANDGTVKEDKNNKYISLTKEQKAFRAGYLTARSDNSKAFNSKNKRK